MKSRQRLGPRRRRSAADRRAGSATAVLRWSFELSPPRAGGVAPVRDSSGGPEDVPGGDRTGWERFAPLRRGRVRAIPAVRHSRQRIRSRALRRLRRRAALKDRADANIRVDDASSSDQVKIAALGLNFARAGASCSNAANPGRHACGWRGAGRRRIESWRGETRRELAKAGRGAAQARARASEGHRSRLQRDSLRSGGRAAAGRGPHPRIVQRRLRGRIGGPRAPGPPRRWVREPRQHAAIPRPARRPRGRLRAPGVGDRRERQDQGDLVCRAGIGNGGPCRPRGEGGFEGQFGQGSIATLDYWFE